MTAAGKRVIWRVEGHLQVRSNRTPRSNSSDTPRHGACLNSVPDSAKHSSARITQTHRDICALRCDRRTREVSSSEATMSWPTTEATPDHWVKGSPLGHKSSGVNCSPLCLAIRRVTPTTWTPVSIRRTRQPHPKSRDLRFQQK